jgi:hypothetical protein
MPSPELNYIIDHTALSRFQGVLRRVCDEYPAARALVEEELLAPSASTNVIDLTADDNNRSVQPVTNTSSVKRQCHAMCKNCKEEFDVTENAEDSCEYHKGWLLGSLLSLLCIRIQMMKEESFTHHKISCRNTRN